MVFVFRVFLVAAAVAGIAGCAAPSTDAFTPADLARIAGYKGADVNKGDGFRFIVMADRNGFMHAGRWGEAIRQINLLRPDFVMCVGDLDKGYTQDAKELEAGWADFAAEHAALKAPFFYAAGNHDVLGKEPRRQYTSRFAVDGRTYYSFDYRGCHFIILDSTPWDQNDAPEIAAAQLPWIEKDLASPAARSAKHVFIFVHHPLAKKPVWPQLRKLIDPSRTTVFNGHTHDLVYREVDGVPCHTLGVTGARGVENRQTGNFQHFTFVTVDGGKPTIAHIPLDQVLPHDFITPASADAARKIVRPIHLSAIGASGGEATLRLSNASEVEVEYGIEWRGQGAATSRMLKAAPGQVLEERVAFGRLPVGAGPVAEVTASYSVDGRPRTLVRKLPLPVVREARATRLMEAEAADLAALAKRVRQAGDSSALAWAMFHDGKSLHVVADVADDKLVTEGKEVWERDGIEVFWDPRPSGQRDSAFGGDCRQLLVGVPADGRQPQVVTSPVDMELAAAVAARHAARPGGYTMTVSIPLSKLGKDVGAGSIVRMDIFADDKDAVDGPTTAISAAGKTESSRQTAHYMTVHIEK